MATDDELVERTMTDLRTADDAELVARAKAAMSPLVNEDMDEAMRDAWLTDLATAVLEALSRKGRE